MRAVADAGPLIARSWLDRLDLLDALFDEVLIPRAEAREVLSAREGTRGLDGLRAAIGVGRLPVRQVGQRLVDATRPGALHRGEVEVIALALAFPEHMALLDDRQARREASARGLRVVGTIGLLYAARQQGLVSAVHPLLVELRRLGYRLHEALLEDARQRDARVG